MDHNTATWFILRVFSDRSHTGRHHCNGLTEVPPPFIPWGFFVSWLFANLMQCSGFRAPNSADFKIAADIRAVFVEAATILRDIEPGATAAKGSMAREICGACLGWRAQESQIIGLRVFAADWQRCATA